MKIWCSHSISRPNESGIKKISLSRSVTRVCCSKRWVFKCINCGGERRFSTVTSIPFVLHLILHYGVKGDPWRPHPTEVPTRHSGTKTGVCVQLSAGLSAPGSQRRSAAGIRFHSAQGTFGSGFALNIGIEWIYNHPLNFGIWCDTLRFSWRSRSTTFTPVPV